MVTAKRTARQGIVEFAVLIKFDTANLLVNRNILIHLACHNSQNIRDFLEHLTLCLVSTVDLVVKNAVLDKENRLALLAARLSGLPSESFGHVH